MATATRVSLFHRDVRTSLSSSAVDILFEQAQLLSEGQVDDDQYYGSTMITVDCARARDWVSDPCDATTVRQVSELLLRDERVRERARQEGEREAERLAQTSLGPIQVELRMRVSQSLVHIDVDVQAPTRRAKAS